MIILDYYEKATICINGHVISNWKQISDKYCEFCGAKNIVKCPHCGIDIRGNLRCPDILSPKYRPPKYCYNCGMPFPWTEHSIESTKKIILEDNTLLDSDRKNLTESISDIVSETPQTTLAAARFKKALLKAGKFTSDALRQFVIEFGCELAVRLINVETVRREVTALSVGDAQP